MKSFIVYTPVGEILRTGFTAPEDFNNQAQSGELVMEGVADDLTQYISAGQVTDKQINPAQIDKTTMISDGIDSITISNLPNPSKITIKDVAEYDVTDGSFQFTINAPGSYQINCVSFPYLLRGVTINAS